MKKLLLIVLVSATFLSGCNSSGTNLFSQALKSNNPGSSDVEVISDAPVKVIEITGYGNVLTTEKSLPLYINSEDTASVSTCYDSCAIAWPPLLVDSQRDVSGDFGTLERNDGELQITRLGKPLYTYTPDKARKVTGDGYKGVWAVVVVEAESLK